MKYFFYLFFFLTIYFQLFLLLSLIDWGKKKRGENENNGGEEENARTLPTVTIIVPCYNEETTVEKTVKSLLALHYPKEKLRIFVVDDGSTDRTWEVIQQFASDPRVRLFHKENEGSKFAALNYALRYVETDLVGVLDADSWVREDALMHTVREVLKDERVMAVIPSMVIADPDSFIRKAQRAEYEIGIFVRKVFAKIRTVYITPGPFSLFRKKVFDTLGPYREAHHTEDAEIALRMQKAGYPIAYSEKTIVYTVGPKTAPKLIKQRIRWTYGFIRNAIDYRELFFNRKYGELGFVVLPMGLFRIFLAVFLFPISLWLISKPLIQHIEKWRSVGFSLDLPHLFSGKIDTFFFHLNPITILSLLGFLFTLISVILGRKILEEQKKFLLLDYLAMLFVYTFVAPLWLAKSLWNAIRLKKSAWR